MTVNTPVPGTVESLLDANKLASLVFEAASAKLAEEGRTNGYPVPKAVWAAYEQAASDLHRTVVAVVLKAPLGTEIHTSEGTLVIAHRHAPDGDVATKAVLTADGWGAITNAWHEGESADSVFYERYTAEGRVGHGWVDVESRKLTQTG